MNVQELSRKWETLISQLSKKFTADEALDLSGILFLVGVQELGKGYIKLKKDQKVEVMHIAICRLLSDYGYYTLIGLDEDGWPHYKLNNKLPALTTGQQNYLLKKALVNYFDLQSNLE